MATDSVFRFEGEERDLAFQPVDPGGSTRLSVAQIEAFNRDGHLSPLPCFDPDEADDFRSYIDWLIHEVVSADDRRNGYSINMYHRVCARMHDLITHPTLVEYATDILGPEVVCWSTHMFAKLPNDAMEVPLHQDANYWPFSPTRSVTAWVAIDDVDDSNAAMHFVTGSHVSGGLEHDELPLDGTVVLNRRVSGHDQFDDTFVNELRAGEVSLHTDLMLHGSRANTSDRRRAGIAVRYIAAEVRAVETGEDWISGAVHVAAGDPSGYWPNSPRPDGEEPHRLARFLGGFDGNS